MADPTPPPRFCLRSALAAAIMLVTAPWLFWLSQEWPWVYQHDPRTWCICASAWGASVLLFAVLAVMPGRLEWVREFALGLLIAMGVLLAVDRLPPVRAFGDRALIFQPRTTVHYTAVDYDITAVSNNLGFRDRDFQAGRIIGEQRIVVLGDSFVFGWGVRSEQSWPKMLEQDLQSLGRRVEVADLGEPGASPFQYANLAERALPLLQPDVVVVGISESNDLDQSGPADTPTAFHMFMERPLVYLLPNLSDWLYQHRHPAESKDLHGLWVQQCQTLLAGLTGAAAQHFATLDPKVQDLYRRGLINPSELAEIVHQADHVHTFDVASPDMQARIATMAHQLARIRQQAEAVGAKLLVVGIPAAVCVNRPAFDGQRQAGFILNDDLLHFDGLDQAVAQAAQQAQVTFFSAEAGFRAHSEEAGLYFTYDNHLAAGGHRLLAELVMPAVMRALH